MRRIRELYWRPDRIAHIEQRHGVTPGEVEEAVFGDPDGLLLRVGPAERDPEEVVYRFLGRAEAGRHLLIVLLFLGQGVALPVTARDMTDAERRRFHEWLTGIDRHP